MLHATEVRKIAQDSRADYFKERREKFKAFHVEVEKNKMEVFENCLQKKSLTKKEWLEKKIEEEIKGE